MNEDVLTIGELAQRMRVSKPVIRRLLKAGKLSAFHIGRQYRIPLSAVMQLQDNGGVGEGVSSEISRETAAP